MPAWRSRLITEVVVVVAVALAAIWLRASISALRLPLQTLQAEHRDALFLISQRADKAEKIAEAALAQLSTYERAVGDKRALEASVAAERAQNDYLRERLTETQRAVMAFADSKVEARVVGQTMRGQEPPEPPYVPGPNRWQAVSGTYQADVEAEGELRRQRVARYDAGVEYEPPVAMLARQSTIFKGPSDYRGLAQRDSGLHLTADDEAAF